MATEASRGLETARLRLRAFRDDEIGELVRLIGNWEVARWLATVPHPYSEADGRQWIAAVRQNHESGRPHRFAIALKDADRLIGGVGLDGNPGGGSSDEPALGYWIGRPYWGNGYAPEAVAAVVAYGFGTLGLGAIQAYTDPENARSQAVLRRCGLEPAGEIALAWPTRNGATRGPLFRTRNPHSRGG